MKRFLAISVLAACIAALTVASPVSDMPQPDQQIDVAVKSTMPDVPQAPVFSIQHAIEYISEPFDTEAAAKAPPHRATKMSMSENYSMTGSAAMTQRALKYKTPEVMPAQGYPAEENYPEHRGRGALSRT